VKKMQSTGMTFYVYSLEQVLLTLSLDFVYFVMFVLLCVLNLMFSLVYMLCFLCVSSQILSAAHCSSGISKQICTVN